MLFCTTILVSLVLIPLISGHMTSHSRYDGAWMWYTHIQRCLDVKLARAGLFVDEVFIHMTDYSSLATISVVFLSSFPCFVERSSRFMTRLKIFCIMQIQPFIITGEGFSIESYFTSSLKLEDNRLVATLGISINVILFVSRYMITPNSRYSSE